MSDYATYDEYDDDNDRENSAAKAIAQRPNRVIADDVDTDYDIDDDDIDVVDERRGPNRAQRRRAQQVNNRSPLRREAEGIKLVGIEHDGEVYWLPADPSDWQLDILEAFEDGKAITALRGLLVADENGNGGWSTLKAKKYRVHDLNVIFDKAARAGGFKTSGN